MLNPIQLAQEVRTLFKADSWQPGPELEDRFRVSTTSTMGLGCDRSADPELVAREIFMLAGQQDFGDRGPATTGQALLTAVNNRHSLCCWGWMVGRAGLEHGSSPGRRSKVLTFLTSCRNRGKP